MGQRYKIGRKKHMVTMYTYINRRAGMIHQIKTEAKAQEHKNKSVMLHSFWVWDRESIVEIP